MDDSSPGTRGSSRRGTLDRVLDVGVPPPGRLHIPRPIEFGLDIMSVTEDGTILLLGWVDDRFDTLESIICRLPGDTLELERFGWARVFRSDLTKIAGDSEDVKLGFWYFDSGQKVLLGADRLLTVELRLASGILISQKIRARLLSRTGMRAAVIRQQSDRTRESLTLGKPETGSDIRVSSYLSLESVSLTHEKSPSRNPGENALDPTEAAIGSQILHRSTVSNASSPGPEQQFRCGTDVFFACPEGAMLVVGWVDDSDTALDSLQVLGPGWECFAASTSVGRARRPDVESSLSSNGQHHFGFWAVMTGQGPISLDRELTLEVTFTDGTVQMLKLPKTAVVSAAALRDITLGYLADCSYYGSPQVEGERQLDQGLGERIMVLGRAVARKFVSNPFVQRFVTTGRSPRASLVICLFGRPEFLFLQAVAFSRLPGFTLDYEFIYVSNSPELSERLVNEAEIAHRIYGVDITLVLLSGNTGFGIANNAGVQHCRSDRILITNPDVFPMSMDWATTHQKIVEQRPTAETKLFGVPLYYDDGSIMHAGMFLELDTGLSSTPSGIVGRQMVRVEHYAKGAPATTERFLVSRPVPAVTGAFMSVDLDWFLKLGGFTEDYVFGHYEDADLCLKSLQEGTPVWLHNAGLRHLEGKGSIRQAAQVGGSIVNRWLFSRRWSGTIRNGMQGPDPARLAEWRPVMSLQKPVPPPPPPADIFLGTGKSRPPSLGIPATTLGVPSTTSQLDDGRKRRRQKGAFANGLG